MGKPTKLKRKQAEERQKRYEKLSLEEKLDRAISRAKRSKHKPSEGDTKEVKRLRKQLEERDKKAA